MEYAQIPTNLLTGDYSDADILAITKYQLLYSLLEFEPTDKNLNKFLTKKQKILVQKFIADIKSYVQKDIDSLNKKRDRNARYYRKQKDTENNHKTFQTSNKQSDSRPIEEIEEINKKFIKPTIEEIQNYCIERNNNINAEQFYNFYESKNWYIGKNKMKDWKAAIRTWEQNQQKYNKNNTKNQEVDYANEPYRPF